MIPNNATAAPLAAVRSQRSSRSDCARPRSKDCELPRANTPNEQLRIAQPEFPAECEPWVLHLRVLARRGLRGEPKLLWQYLWQLANYEPGKITASLMDVQARLGFSETAARRHVKTLEGMGLASVLGWPAGGTARIELADPAHVLVDQATPPPLRLITGDPQRWLFDPDRTPETTPEAASEAVRMCPAPEATPEAAQPNSIPLACARPVSTETDDNKNSSLSVLREMLETLFPYGADLDLRDRQQLASYAVILARGLAPAAWLFSPLPKAAKKKDPAAYLYSCLRNGLVEDGHCSTADVADHFGRLFAAVRPEAVELVPRVAELLAERRRVHQAAGEARAPTAAHFAPRHGEDLAGALNATAAARAAMRARRATPVTPPAEESTP